MILGRLAVAMGDEAANCLVLPAARIAKFFVWSDVVTFLVQAAGGGLSSGGTESMSKLGSRVRLFARPNSENIWIDPTVAYRSVSQVSQSSSHRSSSSPSL